jgi:trimethylamine--corrinoid protein Co-methyltransferase
VRATGIWKKMLAEYLPPPLEPAVKEAIDAYVARRTRELADTVPA